MKEAFIQVEHQGMVYIYREAAVHPGATKYLNDYPLPGEAAGQCDEFATKLADFFRSIGEDNFEVFGFLVNGKSSHIILKKDGVWYDPTGIQFGQPMKVFTDETMPAIYKILKKLDNNQYTNKRMEKVYVSSPAEAPAGVALKTGPNGGKYYDEPVKKEVPKTRGRNTAQLYDEIAQKMFGKKFDNLSDPEQYKVIVNSSAPKHFEVPAGKNKNEPIKTKLSGQANFYDNLYDKNNGVFYRGTAGGKGTGVGVLGKGLYISWDKGMAGAFAKYAAMSGGKPEVKSYKIPKGLKMLDAQSPEMVEIKKSLGVGAYDKIDDPIFAAILTDKAKKMGFDGIISDDKADGLVIFDVESAEEISD